MANNHQIYIGAYLEVKLFPKDNDNTTKECPKHGIIDHLVLNAKFCPLCGNKIINIYHEKLEYIDYDDINESSNYLRQIKCFDNDDDIMIITSNIMFDGTYIDVGTDSKSIPIKNIHDYINKFSELYIEDIKKISVNKYIKQMVYKFGIINLPIKGI